MKSFLAKIRAQKTAILTVIEGQDFDFGKTSGFKTCKNFKKLKFKANGIIKIAVFETSKLSKVISRVVEKSLNFFCVNFTF